MTAAVKLASGSAKAKLKGFLREIEASGAKEPARDKPLLKATLQETQTVSQDEILYVYRVVSEVQVEGMEPITAKLWLSEEGNVWRVSKFAQEE